MDLKKRIVDALNAKYGLEITDGDVRLWKFSNNKDILIEACNKISVKDERIEVDSTNDDDFEYNSGVEFPGSSIEPYYSTS